MTEYDPTRPVRVADVPWIEWSEGSRFGSRYKRLHKPGPQHHVGVLIEELGPGQQSCPLHYHLLEEEHLYILKGTVTLRLGDERLALGEGDYICFPAGQPLGHALVNEGSVPCQYLVIGEHNANDVAIYPDSDKVFIRSADAVFPRSASVDYWQGEIDPEAPRAPGEPAAS